LSNALSCLVMNIRNRTLGDYVNFHSYYIPNLLLVWLAGVTWFCQFFFYGMGQSKLGKTLDFASWTLHMAFIITVGTLWGLYYKEWKGVSSKTLRWLYAGLGLIIFSTILIGYGSYLSSRQ
ncbi:MAG TPA: L-rhamnose/proton symporter RhaT, partial [Saprospiraceae bacterium]|nr:L-rhamnose/proton symporter RhaT [Saprospiraceae bacterium]